MSRRWKRRDGVSASDPALFDDYLKAQLAEGKKVHLVNGRNNENTAVVLRNGEILLGNVSYPSPSAAAVAVTKYPISGWLFWRILVGDKETIEPTDQSVPLVDAWDKLLASRDRGPEAGIPRPEAAHEVHAVSNSPQSGSEEPPAAAQADVALVVDAPSPAVDTDDDVEDYDQKALPKGLWDALKITYLREIFRYEQLTSDTVQVVNRLLQGAAVSASLQSRSKSVESLRAKLERKWQLTGTEADGLSPVVTRLAALRHAAEPDSTAGHGWSQANLLHELLDSFVDLAGVRVLAYTEDDKHVLDLLLGSAWPPLPRDLPPGRFIEPGTFLEARIPKGHPKADRGYYRAIHFRLLHRDANGLLARVEIQLATLNDHLTNEVGHELYKESEPEGKQADNAHGAALKSLGDNRPNTLSQAKELLSFRSNHHFGSDADWQDDEKLTEAAIGHALPRVNDIVDETEKLATADFQLLKALISWGRQRACEGRFIESQTYMPWPPPQARAGYDNVLVRLLDGNQFRAATLRVFETRDTEATISAFIRPLESWREVRHGASLAQTLSVIPGWFLQEFAKTSDSPLKTMVADFITAIRRTDPRPFATTDCFFDREDEEQRVDWPSAPTGSGLSSP